MSSQPQAAPSADLAEQAQRRTTAPAALHEHSTHDHSHDHDHDHHHDDDHDHHDHDHAFEWPEMLRIALVAVAAVCVWLRLWEPFAAVSVIGVIGLAIGGWPIFKEALENLLEKRMTMELSMSIAIIAAAAIAEFFTALVITLFVLVAEVLEGLTVSRGRRAIHDLLDFLPRAVSVRRAGEIAQVEAEALAIGDAVLVNPGGRIPVDGVVIAGHSFVDQARITELPLNGRQATQLVLISGGAVSSCAAVLNTPVCMAKNTPMPIAASRVTVKKMAVSGKRRPRMRRSSRSGATSVAAPEAAGVDMSIAGAPGSVASGMMSGTTGSTCERGASDAGSAGPSTVTAGDGVLSPISIAGAAATADSTAGASTSRPTSGTAGRNSDSISVIVAWIALRRLMATSTVTPGLAWSARSSAAKADR